MNNAVFWSSIHEIINGGFSSDGLIELERYAEQFIRNGLVYKRFSPIEQYGCSTGGTTHVIATLLAGAETQADNASEGVTTVQREFEQAEKQTRTLEAWARKVGLWWDNVEVALSNLLGGEIAEGGEAKVYDHGATLIKSIGLDYYIEPALALDRVSLHNTFFPETRLTVVGFGRDDNGAFKIIVEQPFIIGSPMKESEIQCFVQKMGFALINPKNWTYSTPSIYLSDMHDENVLKSSSGTVFVVDCDIRINTSSLRAGGTRRLTTEVEFVS